MRGLVDVVDNTVLSQVGVTPVGRLTAAVIKVDVQANLTGHCSESVLKIRKRSEG